MRKKCRKMVMLLLGVLMAGGLTLSMKINANAEEGDVVISSDTFPDEAFRTYVKERFDKDGDNTITKEEVSNIKSIIYMYDCYDVSMKNMKGIEYFTSVEEINVGHDGQVDITELDLKNNKKLKKLVLNAKNIQKLDISKNTDLEYLKVNRCNGISELNLNNYKKLKEIELRSWENLESIDVSGCSGLEKLLIWESEKLDTLKPSSSLCDLDIVECSRLNGLDLAKNTELEMIIIRRVGISDIDISNSKKLKNININNTNIKEFDLSNNSALQSVFIADNKNTQLDISFCPNIVKAYKEGEYSKGSSPGTMGFEDYLFKNSDGTSFELTFNEGVKIIVDSKKPDVEPQPDNPDGGSDKKEEKKDDSNKKESTPKYSNEWVDGKWYDADGSQTYKGTLSWKNDSTGWWIDDGTGWYPTNSWQKIDGVWYFFKPDGYMASNEYYNGYWFNKDGSWDEKYFLSWKQNSTGWWVEDISGWWPKSSWLKIDGYWYYFDASGYMVTNQYIDGWWIGADGVCY